MPFSLRRRGPRLGLGVPSGRGDPAAPDPAAPDPAKRKPAEREPAEREPAEKSRATEGPAEREPAAKGPAEIKPAEWEPAVDGPAGREPAEKPWATEEPAEREPAAKGPVAPLGDSDRAGHALRAPSALHSFNRYEIKYLVDEAAVPALREELTVRLDRDSHGGPRGYGVWSVYYDTPRLRFYWEKIEGLRFRRKLRIRHYGDRFGVDRDTTVFVEIKQRVNRVTQKRRVALPYELASQLCDGRAMVDHDPAQRAFLEEVLGLVSGLDLRPVAVTGYQREAFIGRDADVGLRVTLDHRVRGRDRDFDLAAVAENRLIVPASRSVLEVKANDRVPYWLTDLAATMNIAVVRVSKYCQCVEAFGRAPRSIFHVPDHLAYQVPDHLEHQVPDHPECQESPDRPENQDRGDRPEHPDGSSRAPGPSTRPPAQRPEHPTEPPTQPSAQPYTSELVPSATRSEA